MADFEEVSESVSTEATHESAGNTGDSTGGGDSFNENDSGLSSDDWNSDESWDSEDWDSKEDNEWSSDEDEITQEETQDDENDADAEEEWDNDTLDDTWDEVTNPDNENTDNTDTNNTNTDNTDTDNTDSWNTGWNTGWNTKTDATDEDKWEETINTDDEITQEEAQEETQEKTEKEEDGDTTEEPEVTPEDELDLTDETTTEEWDNVEEEQTEEKSEIEKAWETLNEGLIEKSESLSWLSVKVEAPANTFPDGTQLRIVPIIWADLDNVKQQILWVNTKVQEDSLVAFDIKFVYELSDWSEIKVQPKENNVQVKFNFWDSDEFKNISSKQLKIYHIEDKSENVSNTEELWEVKSMKKTKSSINNISSINEIKSLNIDKTNKIVSLDADSFSIYAIIKTDIPESVTVNYNAWDGKFAWNVSTVTVTYTLTNGDYVADKATQQPNEDGYMFKWWYTTNACSTRWDGIVDDTTSAEMTVYACYLPFLDYTQSFGRFSFTMMDRNLWAESTSDYWYYYQWWNNYWFDNWLTPAVSTDLVSTNTYNWQPRWPDNLYSSSNFISRSSSPFRWDSADNRNLWWGTYTDQEDWQWPCPDGYHVPNSAEWKAVYETYIKSWYVAKDFGTTLWLPFAGYRDTITAWSLQGQWYDGWYWASNAYNSDSAYALTVSDSSANATNNKYRSYANSVRCFKNTDTVTITFESNEWSAVGDMTFDWYEARTTSLKPVPTKEGISFAWWYYDSELTEEFTWANNTYVTEDTTLYAKWWCEPWYVLNNSNECVLRVVTVNYMLWEDLYKTMTYARNASWHYLPTTTNFTVPQKEWNYMFDQWYLDEEFTQLWKYPMDNDGLWETVTVYGNFLPFEDKTITVNGTSFTVMDRNLWAKSASLWYDDTTSENIWYYYQYGNNYWFPTTGEWDNITSEQVKNPLTASSSAWSRTNPYSNWLFVTVSPWNTNSLTSLWWWYYANQNPDSYKIWPCPDGYHIPEYLEYEAVYAAIKSNKAQFSECNGLSDWYCVSKVLWLPFGGYRAGGTSVLSDVWSAWYYGMSSYYSYSQWYREKIENTSPSAASSNRSSWNWIAAFSLRCFKDTDRYVLTFNANGGTTPATQYIWWWKPYTTQTSTRYGSVFSGWYLDNEYQNKFEWILTADTTVYARWDCADWFTMDENGDCVTDQRIYVTFKANPSTFPGWQFSDGTTEKTIEYKGMPAGYFAAVEEEIQVPDLAWNYMFEWWYIDTTYASAARWTWLSVNSPSEMTLYARYLPFNEKTLTWDGVSFTIMDRNLWATDYVSGYSYSTTNSPVATRWNYFQWWNNFWFPTEGTYPNTVYNTFVERISDTARWPWNYYYNGTFIRRPESPWYWNSWSVAWENLWWWGGTNVTNGANHPDTDKQWPCPEWYHVPYTTEWLATKNLFDKWALTEAWSAYCSSIHDTNTAIQYCMPAALGLPFAGYRSYSSSSVGNVGSNGYYWSSTAYSADFAYLLLFYSSSLIPQNGDRRAYGFSVRCYKDSPSLTLTFDSNGGSSVSSQTNFRWWQARSSKPTNPTRANSTFVGWFADENLTQDFTFSSTTYVSENTTLYAKWTCKDGYSLSADGQRCEWSSVVTFNATTNWWTTSRPVVSFKSWDTVNLSDYTATKAWWNFVWWNTSQTAKEAMDDFVIWNDGVRVYAIFKKDLTATFKRNGNDSQTSNGNTTTDDIEKTCTIRNNETSCNVTTPTITSTVTKKILGYSDSATNHVGTYGVNSNISISANVTLYAQTMTDPLDRLITFNPNGNTSFTYNWDTQTTATDYVLCTIPAVYNGVTQSNQCTQTITFPDITPNGEKTVLWWSTWANVVDNLISTWASQELVATKNLVYYAQSQSDGKTFTITFYGNGATVSWANSWQETCTIEWVYNGWVPATECDVDVPSIAREWFTILWFDADENAQTATYSTSVDKITVSADRSFYAISNKPVSVKFYKNWNDSQIRDGQSVADTSEFVSESCTVRNKATSCSVITPQIVSVNTPTILWYSTAENDHTVVVNQSSSLSVSNNANYYAQTKKEPRTIYVSFYVNWNGWYTYNSTSYTEDSTHELCTIEAVYNGVTQPSTCSISVDFPTISAPTNTPTVLWWSNSNTNHTPEYSDWQTAIVEAWENKHYFAQTTKEAITLMWTFNKWTWVASLAYTQKWCTIAAIYNGNDGNEQATSCLVEFPSFELKPWYENPIWQQATLWNQNANTTSSLPISDNTTFTLVVSTISYSITYDKQWWTLVDEKTSYTVEDDNFTLKVPTKKGYTFEWWTWSNWDEPQTSVTVSKWTYWNLNYTANWSLDTYTISYDLDGWTVSDPNPEEYNVNTENFTLNNPTKVWHTFAGWTWTSISTPKMSVTVRKWTVWDLEYFATYTKNPYEVTLTYEPSTWGSVSGDGTYEYWDEITLRATPDTGYHFVSWNDGDDVITTSNPYVFTADETGWTGLKAVFELNEYEVNTDTNDSNKWTVTWWGTNKYGQRVTLVAHPILWYKLEKWLKNGVVVTTWDNEIYTWLELEVDVTEVLNVTWHFVARDDIDYTVKHWQQNVDDNDYTEVEADREEKAGATNEQTAAVAKPYVWFTVQPITQQTIAADGSTVVNVYYDRDTYTVTWKDDNWTVLETDTGVRYGATPVYDGATPTKEADAQYTYTFAWWTPSVAEVSWDVEYTATYNSTVNEYTITWKDGNGETLKTEQVAYGATPVYDGATPTKTATAQYTYTFNNTWSPEVVAVVWDATYTAQFDSAVNKYTIRFVNEDGTELQSSEVEYWTLPVYSWETPAKPSTAEFDYVFADWDSEVVAVTQATTYTATYTSTKRSYTITWKNDDGSTIDTTAVEYWTTPTHADATKEATAQYTYTFGGWSPEVVEVTADATYTATYTSTIRSYEISVSSNDTNKWTVSWWTTQEYGKSVKVIATPKIWYRFSRWTEGWETVSTEAEYEFNVEWTRNLVAEFVANNDTNYTVNYVAQNLYDDDYSIIKETLPQQGTTDTLTTIPERTYDWLKLKWTLNDYRTEILPDWSTVVNVLYDRIRYTITYDPANGTPAVSFEAKYEKPLTPPANPEKQWYTFAGWLPEFPATTPLNGTSVVAQWTPNTNTAYRVEYYYQWSDGSYPATATSWDNRTWTTDETASVTDADKTPSLQWYAFAEWYDGNVLNWTVAADGSLVLKVYFKKQFTVTYKPWDRWTFADDVHDWLDYNSDTPSFAWSLDHQDWYIFKSWDSTIATKVTANAVYTALWAEDFNNDGIDDATQDRYIVTYTDWVDGEEIFVNQTTSNLLSWFNTPAFSGTPTREHYLFAWWNPTVADKVTWNAVYTATWNEDFNDNGIDDATEPHFTVRFEAWAHWSLVGTLIYNNVLSWLTLNDLWYIEPTKQPAENYMFSGWNIEVNPSSKITGNVTYTAIWWEDKNHDGQNDEFEDKYTVTINYVYSRWWEAATKYEITNQLSGFTYDVVSPSIEYYTSDIVEVSGRITGNVNVTVTYTPDNDTNGNGVADELETEYKVTVNYVYSRGWEASPSVSGMYLSGISFSFTSPYITYYHADQSVISGKWKEEAQTFTVTYTPDNDENHDGVADEEEDKYTVTINYVYSRWWEAATKYEITNQLSGFTYNVDSPSVIYYHADKTNVSGTITGNVEVTVTYTPDNDTNGNGVADEQEDLYKITVNYVYVDWNTAAESVSWMYLSGISYSFESPVINHYTADVLVVSGVTVWTETFTVTYVANKYEIKFVNYDGSVLQTSQVEYWTLPVYEGEAPTKDATDGYIYTFAGWTPEISEVAWDTTYTATFTENRKGYSWWWGRHNTDEDNQSHNSAEDEQQEGTDNNTQPIVTDDNKSKYSEEVIDAYTWAYWYDITTMDTLDKAMPNQFIIRWHLAKMAVNYAVNVLWREIPSEIPDKCSWWDDESVWESAEIKDYAEKSCALWVMWIKVKNFDPNKIVSRAEFWTVLSRLLWWDTYDVENPTDKNLYYVKHLKALNDSNIMKDIDNPVRRNELREWIWVMFRRAKELL